jgi:hypothetical protein
MTGMSSTNGSGLEALFATVPAREHSGSISTNAFAYQKSWALLHLLTLHESGMDYVLLLEFHDDVAVLDREVDPQEVSFYQVKTKRKGIWNSKALVRRERQGMTKGTGASILGKLCLHMKDFGTFVRELAVVSNANFQFEFASGGKSEDHHRISFLELDESERSQISGALRAEYPESEVWKYKNVLFFLHSEVPLANSDTYVLGKLTEFLDARFPDKNLNVIALKRVLLDECGRRANKVVKDTRLSEIVKHKGISRRYFEEKFNALLDPKTLHNLELMFRNQLGYEGVSFDQIQSIAMALRRHATERSDQTNDECRMVTRAVNDICKRFVHGGLSLADRLNHIAQTARKEGVDPLLLYSDDYMKAIAIFAIYEY